KFYFLKRHKNLRSANLLKISSRSFWSCGRGRAGTGEGRRGVTWNWIIHYIFSAPARFAHTTPKRFHRQSPWVIEIASFLANAIHVENTGGTKPSKVLGHVSRHWANQSFRPGAALTA
ncbi:unnamed protein product, partial [Ectocarpus sp. 12 AP-2014]